MAVGGIGNGHAKCREHGAGIGQDKLTDSQVAGELGTVGAGRAAIGIERERPRVMSALDGHLPDQVGHAGIDDLKNSGGGICHVHAERLGDLVGDRALGQIPVKFVDPAEKILGIDDAAGDKRVRDRRIGAAPGIMRRVRDLRRRFADQREDDTRLSRQCCRRPHR